jgi:hypothetical protein
MTLPLPIIQEEAQRIIRHAEEQGMRLRLLGGLAVHLHSPSASRPPLLRDYPDMDFATDKSGGRKVEALLSPLGYTANQGFNMFNGDRRLLFYDESHNRQVDIFIGRFQMCHALPISDRLDQDPVTVPLAELFLSKMQIVHINEKDMRDLCALLLDHPFGNHDNEVINLPFIAGLCANDWGLWKTISLSAQKVHDFCDAYALDAGQKLTIIERLDVLCQGLDDVPKSLKWKARSKIGERLQWYDLPEEVQRG